MINRRDVFRNASLLALGAALGLPAARWAEAAVPLAGTQNAGWYRFKVGEYEITAINDGYGDRPIDQFVRNADLGQVRAVLAENGLSTETFRIPFTSLVVNTGPKLVLLDTGNGDNGAPTARAWMTNFRAAGFTPEQVDVILISHFHGDHIGGLRLKDGTEVFPKAELHVPTAEWAFWMSDDNAAKAPDAMKPAFDNVRRVFTPVRDRLVMIEPGKEPVTGITAIDAYGHTPGHTVFAIASGSGRLLYVADTTNNPVLLARNPSWGIVFDVNLDDATATRRRVFDMAIADKLQLSFYHAPFPATGFVAKDGPGYRFAPAAWSAAL